MANKFDYNAHKERMRAIIANAGAPKGPGQGNDRKKILDKLLGKKPQEIKQGIE